MAVAQLSEKEVQYEEISQKLDAMHTDTSVTANTVVLHQGTYTNRHSCMHVLVYSYILV